MILGEMRHRTQRKLRWKQCNPEVVEEKGGLGICGVSPTLPEHRYFENLV
jgi:hypothetical protein